jgi:hypothetical protein
VAWSWRKDDELYLIVINLSDGTAQARVQIPWGDIRGETLYLSDAFSEAAYARDGDEMLAPGLFVELGPYDCSFLKCSRLQKPATI